MVLDQDLDTQDYEALLLPIANQIKQIAENQPAPITEE